jgi:hypothetical protein
MGPPWLVCRLVVGFSPGLRRLMPSVRVPREWAVLASHRAEVWEKHSRREPQALVARLLVGLPEGEPVALAVGEHRPPAEGLPNRRLRELDALGGQLAMSRLDVTTLEHHV